MQLQRYKILCVDNDESLRELLAYTFKIAGFDVEVCATGEECLEKVGQGAYQAVVLDGFFGSSESVEVCRELRRANAKLPVIYLSGETRQKEIDKALAVGASAYLIKPKDFEKLVETAERLIIESLSSE